MMTKETCDCYARRSIAILSILTIIGCAGEEAPSQEELDAAISDVSNQLDSVLVGDSGPSADAVNDAATTDVETLDIQSEDDSSLVDTPTDVAATCPGAAGCPCGNDAECASGACLETREGKRCAEPCIDACNDGFTCAQIDVAGDLKSFCVDQHARSCSPCASAADCAVAGATGAACVDHGAAGAFCGSSCDSDSDCPGGYQCADAADITGQTSKQCVPKGEAGDIGVCVCSVNAVELAKQATCSQSLVLGKQEATCEGLTMCSKAGQPAACDATKPATEVCDDVDNDCDGETDEGSCVDDKVCVQSVCGGAQGCQSAQVLDGTPCDADGDACTDSDACAAGVCLAGAVTDCDDANPCTVDTCDKGKGCQHAAAATGLACDADGDPCTAKDACKGGVCLAGALTVCDDSSPCTVDSCDKSSGKCVFDGKAKEGDACDADGNLCTVGDACKAAACVPGLTTTCDDKNPCTVDSCDKSSGKCVFDGKAKEGDACDADGSLCTVDDACKAGACAAGPGKTCDDGNACTDDGCDAKTGCQFKANSATCSDGDACTTGDTCKANTCVAGGKTTCDDGEACTHDVCDTKSGKCIVDLTITQWKNGTTCDDGDACSQKDSCKEGKCAPGKAKTCDDGKGCTDDSCDAKTGCVFKNNTKPCDDGDACSQKDSCKEGKCAPGKAKTCDDGKGCTDDSCDAKTGCVFKNNTKPCDDGDACSQKDSCKEGKCAPGKAKTCDDGKGCTDDSCDAKTGCVFKNNTKPCDDGDACTSKDTCAAGSCTGAKITCADGSVCTTDTCDKSKGCTYVPLKDGLACDSFAGSGTCSGGKCNVKTSVPVTAAKDYAFWHWPGNHRPTETWPKVFQVMHFLTGHYGMAFESSTGQIKRLGFINSAPGYRAARLTNNSVINAMPAADIRFEAGASSAGIVATSFLGASKFTVDRTRMIDGGRFMNRIYVPTVGYAKDSGLAGEVQIASMARHLVWTHTLKGSSAAAKVARISLGGAALAPYKTVKWLVPKRALQLTNAAGKGWVFIVADDKQHTLTRTGAGAVVAQRSVSSVPASGVKVSLLIAPAHALSAQELALYLNPTKAVTVKYSLLNLSGKQVGATVNAPWDPTLGAFRVTLKPMTATGAPAWPNYDQAVYHNWYGRHRIEIVRSSDAKISIPLAMHGPHKIAWYIVGGIPMWRDLKGNPLGLPLQISKNWHGQTWYHLYSQPTIAKKGTSGMELTVASSRWGKPYAVSHAQLSLIGWGKAGGHWDESAVGAFGESITYDPDLTLGRAMVDDIRPLLVMSEKKWNWTGNVGGADFLRYRDAKKWYWERRLSRVRSVYRAIGPNISDVGYTGVSTDGAIQADIRTQLVASDDMVRVYYHLNYTFLKDVDYHSLAFFQIAADNYADNGFTRYAYGDAKGKTFEAQIPVHNKTGYISDKDRGVAIKGDAPWVLLFKSNKTGDKLPERFANIGFVVRDYQLKVGGKTITTPHINMTRTYNGKSPQMAFQLGVPHETGAKWCGTPCKGKQRFIPKGSTLKATVEYLVLPADKTRYYGASDHLKATPAADFASHQLMRRVAAGNQLTVTSKVGKLTQKQPIEVQVAQAAIAADVTVVGGLSYTPLTFRGLKRYDGWVLQEYISDKWQVVKLAVRGKDFAQANYDAMTQTWSLSFSIPNPSKSQRFRLVYVAGS